MVVSVEPLVVEQVVKLDKDLGIMEPVERKVQVVQELVLAFREQHYKVVTERIAHREMGLVAAAGITVAAAENKAQLMVVAAEDQDI